MEAGLVISGVTPDDRLVEIVELADHPWFVACQYHPEFKSRPTRPHPLFRDFVGAAPSRRWRRGVALKERPLTDALTGSGWLSCSSCWRAAESLSERAQGGRCGHRLPRTTWVSGPRGRHREPPATATPAISGAPSMATGPSLTWLLGAHLDTVAATDAIEPVLDEEGVFRNTTEHHTRRRRQGRHRGAAARDRAAEGVR